MNLSSKACRTVNDIDKVSEGLNLDAIAGILHTQNNAGDKNKTLSSVSWQSEWTAVAAAGAQIKAALQLRSLNH